MILLYTFLVVLLECFTIRCKPVCEWRIIGCAELSVHPCLPMHYPGLRITAPPRCSPWAVMLRPCRACAPKPQRPAFYCVSSILQARTRFYKCFCTLFPKLALACWLHVANKKCISSAILFLFFLFLRKIIILLRLDRSVYCV